jgi:D-alanine-D-alanine ligase
MERRLQEWTGLGSHTDDPVGVREAVRRAERIFKDLGMSPVEELTDERSAWTWQTGGGLDGGTLLVGHVDVPVNQPVPSQMFRKEPEWLYGEGIGSSRAPLVMLEFALRALRSARRLKRRGLGVLLYMDEGRDARYSAELIRQAAKRAARVLVLRPGNVGDYVVPRRRGQRRYRFRVVGEPRRPGRASKKPEVLRWAWRQLETLAQLSDRKERVSVSTLAMRTEASPMLLPHRVHATVLLTYPDAAVADALDRTMRESIPKNGPRWELEEISDRPSMRERRSTLELARSLTEVAGQWEIPLKRESSVWPSVAGLVPSKVPVLCGIGPVARDLGTPQEAVQRISLIQRTLLLAQFLLKESTR